MIEAGKITETDIVSNKSNVQIFNNRRRNSASGTNLIEVMVATAILAISVIGASGYRYYSSLNTKWAEVQTTAARLGNMLCGSWAGVKGDQTYNPAEHFYSSLDIDTLATTNDLPAGFVKSGGYRITLEGIAYDCVLAWQDISSELRALWVRVEWNQKEQDLSNPDPALAKSFIITTYVPRQK